MRKRAKRETLIAKRNMFRFENLEIWRLSVEYAKKCYGVADKFPSNEKFALADQLRRSAISISNNIAEGSIGSPVSFSKYLKIAAASAMETVNIINFAYEVDYISKEDKKELYEKADEIIRKIINFEKSLQK